MDQPERNVKDRGTLPTLPAARPPFGYGFIRLQPFVLVNDGNPDKAFGSGMKVCYGSSALAPPWNVVCAFYPPGKMAVEYSTVQRAVPDTKPPLASLGSRLGVRRDPFRAPGAFGPGHLRGRCQRDGLRLQHWPRDHGPGDQRRLVQGHPPTRRLVVQRGQASRCPG